MDYKLTTVSIAAIAATLSPAAAAFSRTVTKPQNEPPLRHLSLPPTALHYRNYHASYYENVDVDGDRMSLLSLLDPPSPPYKSREESTAPRTKAGAPAPSGRVTRSQRAYPITQLRSIQDYHRHVLYEPNRLCVVRFSAPWCRVCRSTEVAWERMASRIHRMIAVNDIDGGERVKFLSVSLEGGNEDAAALKDMLQISRVPQGIVHHASEGVFGQRVDLDRKNLSSLRKRLETYLGEGETEFGIVLEGLHG